MYNKAEVLKIRLNCKLFTGTQLNKHNIPIKQ